MMTVTDLTRFETTFRLVYPRAVALAHRILGDRQAAEDVASEAFARALLRWHRLDPERVTGWILRVTANQAIDILRKKTRTVAVGVVNLEDQMTLRLALVAALQQLPRRQREAIALRYLSDLTEAETASALGVATGTVKAHVHRGLAALRDQLGYETVEAAGVRN